MLKYVALFALVATYYVVVADEIPEECKHLVKKQSMDCCDVPKVFSQENMLACGFPADVSIAHAHPPGPPPCDKSICLLKKYDLISGEDKVNKDALKALLEKTTSSNPEFAAVADMMKSKCLEDDLTKMGRPDVCEPMKIQHCVDVVYIVECPKWKASGECAQAQQQIEKCKKHFKKIE